VQELARTYTEQAVRTLVEALDDPKLKVSAACALLDRAWGRPVQMLATPPDSSPVLLHLVAAQAISAQLIAALDEPRTINGSAEPTELPAGDLLSAAPPLE
jgi:uncharacterized protein (DUF1778 family)